MSDKMNKRKLFDDLYNSMYEMRDELLAELMKERKVNKYLTTSELLQRIQEINEEENDNAR